MLVVTIILGVVVTVISGVVAVILRTQGPLATTTDDSRSLRGAVTWLAQDVAGVPPTGFDFSTSAASGCSGGDAGSSLVRLAWTEASTSTVNYVANYRFVDDGTSKVIERYTCSGTGAAPYANRSVLNRDGRTGGDDAGRQRDLRRTQRRRRVDHRLLARTANRFTSTPAHATRRRHCHRRPRHPVRRRARPPPVRRFIQFEFTSSSSSSSSSSTTTIPLPFGVVDQPAGDRFQPGQRRQAVAEPVHDHHDGVGIVRRHDAAVRPRRRSSASRPARSPATSPNFTYTFASSNSEEWSETAHTITIRSGGAPLSPTYTFTVT